MDKVMNSMEMKRVRAKDLEKAKIAIGMMKIRLMNFVRLFQLMMTPKNSEGQERTFDKYEERQRSRGQTTIIAPRYLPCIFMKLRFLRLNCSMMLGAGFSFLDLGRI